MILTYTKNALFYRLFIARIIFFAILLCMVCESQAKEDVWLLVDTQALTLEIKKGNKTLEKMENIAIGRNGAGFKSHRGDDITPLGLYRIGWVNSQSSYHRFFGLAYPSVDNAYEAIQKGLIKPEVFDAIVGAHQQNKVPPQSTPLGGQVGIHGLGKGDEKVHKTMNWTHGCIALTNRQIDRLSRWLNEKAIVLIK